MATPIEAADDIVITKAERRLVASPIGWSSIFAASVVAISVWLLLHLFGIGVGLTAIEPDDPGSLKGVGIGAGIWSLVAPLIALFVGGLVAGRIAPTVNWLNAAIHGAVMWGLTCVLSFIVIAMTISALVRGVSNVAGDVAGAAPISQIERIPAAVGLDARDLVAPINKRLQAQGMPKVTPEQLEKILEQSVSRAVRDGGVDRAALVDITARNTALSRAESEQVATQIEGELQSAVGRGKEMASRAGEKALQAAETAGKFVLTIALMMLLGLGAAIGGSILSVRHERHENVVLPRAGVRT